jgi:uncharacterized membrane protein YhaH (DUF805 family)
VNRSKRPSPSLLVVRYALPAATAVTGIVLIAVGDDAGRGAGIVLVGVAGLVLLANLMIRLSMHSQRDRDREERRRRFFSEHGRWPRS